MTYTSRPAPEGSPVPLAPEHAATEAAWPPAACGSKGPPFTCLGHYDEAQNKLNFFYAGPDAAPQ